MPVATSKEESVSHSYAGLASYFGVSPDRQLFVEFNVNNARKCAPYMDSLCLLFKPIAQKGRMKSCTEAVFLQEQEGIQRNCRLETGKDNVTVVLQCLEKGSAELAFSKCYQQRGLCSDTSDEWVLQASFRQMLPENVTSVIDEEPAGLLSGLLASELEQLQTVTKNLIMEETYAYRPRGEELKSESG
ncbi:hypothetical protein OUZ56_005981 [Daphnia magna]|uniref:Vitellogenin domain-containing protein n=1 Tax=Daphnia magna TaxID=35525 RepID=A0ABQ9YUC9_9CRUS|nr:hypothetical protein OUZ56_005981 [Daphnia magna]